MKDNILITLAWLVIIGGTLIVHSQEFEDEQMRAEMRAAEAGTDKYLILKEDIMELNLIKIDEILDEMVRAKHVVTEVYRGDGVEIKINYQGTLDDGFEVYSKYQQDAITVSERLNVFEDYEVCEDGDIIFWFKEDIVKI